MKRPLGIALALALACWLAYLASSTQASVEKEHHEAHAPFWLASDGAGAAILLNNAAPQGFAFTLRLHSPDGLLLHTEEHFADSAASLTIPVSGWLDGLADAGYAVLEYPAAFRGRLPAQMVVSSADEGVSVNYLFQERRNALNPDMHWAFWIPSARSEVYLMLLNRSDEPIDAKISTGGGEIGEELRIAPSSMRRLRLSERLAPGLPAGAAGGIRLSHSGSPGDLLAEGFVLDLQRGISYTLDRFHFAAHGLSNLVYPLLRHGRMTMGQHEAVFRPLAVLSNGSLLPMEVQPLVRLDGGEAVQLEGWILEPLESRAVDLHRLLRRQLPWADSFDGALELAHSGEAGDLAASLLSLDPRSGRIHQSAVKPEGHLSLGYSYPFRLSEGWNTRIYLTNRSAQPVEMCVFLHFDGQSYTWSGTKELEPFESRSIDIGQLRDEQVPDEFGSLIPLGTASGQAILVVHSDGPASIAAQAVLENEEAGLALPAACSVCPPSDVKLYLRKNRYDPEFTMASYVGLPGEKERIYAVVRNSLGGEKDVSSSAGTSYTSTDDSVAKEKKSFGKAEVEFFLPGVADRIGANFWGRIYSEPLGGCGSFFEEGECSCEFQEVPLSVPEAGALFGGANPAAHALVLQPTVNIADTLGVPKNGTKDIQVTIPQGPLNVDVELKLSTTAGSGSARFASNNSTTLKVRQSGAVSVKGMTESSTADNIRLEAKLGSSVLASEQFSVVWVTFNNQPRTTGLISSDNEGGGAFAQLLGANQLQVVQDTTGFWVTPVEIVGTVAPPNYTGSIVLVRRVSTKVYDEDNVLVSQKTNSPDTSNPDFRDDDPQSGGSMGRVYDLDSPGVRLLPSAGVLDKRRQRLNAVQWAVLDNEQGPKVSADLQWFSRVSVKKDIFGRLVLSEDVQGDNQAGRGTTPLSWNLQ